MGLGRNQAFAKHFLSPLLVTGFNVSLFFRVHYITLPATLILIRFTCLIEIKAEAEAEAEAEAVR